ncbi:uncharacterized protein FTOL_08272 [Fusarium torulosum]|uniref:Uncharacterized protein n=1 Tax=Fusarium torulosum TaxID=33205 RepID=A0AAE8SK23_9HYPO|nr:uncharacterized protein FTOL_08272 [Fusarium torulosum]
MGRTVTLLRKGSRNLHCNYPSPPLKILFVNPQSPSRSPQTPGGYQVNVNRSKTRKWVQAPVQNYDGDDWGADEFEDDEPPPPPVPRVTTGLRSIGQRLPNESHGPSPRLAAAVASSSRGSSGPPSLQLQTQHPDAAFNTTRPEEVHNVPSQIAGRTGSPAPLSSGAGSSKAPSYHQQPEVRSSTPQSTTSSAARASPSMRPDLYRHLDDERKLGGSPLSIADNIAPRPDDRSTPASEANRQGFGQGDGPTIDRVQKQPTFDSILAKRDELGMGQKEPNSAPVPDSGDALQQSNNHNDETVIHSPTDIDRKRLSVSPQLPDVARMSVFGADFFSTGNDNSRNAPPSSHDPIKQEYPLSSHQSTDSPGNLPTLDEKPRESEDSSSMSGSNDTSSNKPSLLPANDPRSVPPLRTPSPNTKGLFPSPREPDSAAEAASKLTPTEPLHPRQLEYSPSDYEPNSALTQGTLNTFNSSPIKESDVLSEEIMRSLSPIAPTPNSGLSPQPPLKNTQSLSPGGQNNMRNSSYTLSDYDNYWADSNEKPGQESGEEVETQAHAQEKPKAETAPMPEQQQQSTTEQPSPGILPSSGAQPAPDSTSQPESPVSDSRRRFSWEAGFESPPKILPVVPPTVSFNNEAPVLASPSQPASSDIQLPKDADLNETGQNKDSSRNFETPTIVIPPSGGISHQVSKASTLPPSQQPATLEPPSPVSVENDSTTPQAADDRRPSVTENKTLTRIPSNLTSATPPPGKATRAISSSEFPQTTPWRDIMSLATPVQRTLKFEAGRETHQAWESGLENWLSGLMTEHPEYANGTASFAGASVPAPQKGHGPGPSVSQTQQPYYQQYLNASSPTTGPAVGRSRLGSGSMPSGSSSFGNSGGQIGTKSKELMQSAGKMGKGLFSKGKSKLRGTGDKGEPTSPVQTKLKTERRASWGLDRLTRARADETPEKDVVNSRPSTQSYHAPQSSQSSSILPSGSVSSTIGSGKRLASHEGYGPQLSQEPSAFASKEHDERPQWYIPTPVDESTWDPFKETSLTRDNVSEHSGALLANQDQPQQCPSTQVSSSKLLSSDAAPLPTNSGIRMVPSEEKAATSNQQPSVYAAVTQETPSVQAQPQSNSQPFDSSTTPQRHSSFVGLPPIRRGSTFDVNSRSTKTEPKTTETIDEHFTPKAEDYDELARQQGTLTSEVTVGSTLVGTDSILQGKEFEKDVDEPEQQDVAQQPPPGQQQAFQGQQQHPPQSLPQHPFQMHPVNMHAAQQGPIPPQSSTHQPPSLPLLPPHLMGGNPVQKLPPSGPWKLEESHLSEPLHRVTPKSSPLLPSGQWKLEESHLAEPLHVVNRNRAGTNASQRSQISQHSQQDPFFGYNKETGDVPPSPSSGSTTQHQHHQRQKPSEVPPSSANRYPGLFPGQQRRQSNPLDGPLGPASQFPRRMSQEGGIARAGTGNNEPAQDERGRSKKASALFKDIGHRFRKSSTERRGTPEQHGQQYQSPRQQQQSQHGEVPSDAASVSSVTTDGTHDRKKSRASFMLGLRSKQSRERLSMPPPPRPDDNRPVSSMEDRRASRLNPGFDPTSGQRPDGPPRAFTSNLANEMSQSASATPPAKKRFSAFGTKAAMAGVFNRPSSGTYSKPGTPTSSRPISSHLGAQQPVSVEQPHPGFERSSTAGPSFSHMLPTPSDGPPSDERRKRRGSAAGLLSGFLGHGNKNKEPQQSTPPQGQQPPVQQPQARHPSGPQLDAPRPPSLQAQGRKPSGPLLPQMPGAYPESPMPTPLPSGPQTADPMLASPQPQRPQQPPMIRQATGGSMPRDQSPMSTSRSLAGGMRENQHAPAAYRNSRPSPLGFGSTTPAGTPPIGAMSAHSRQGTPQTPSSVGQSFPDHRAPRMRSISPAGSAIRSAPTTQTSFNVPSTAPTTQPSFHHSTQSLDKLAQTKKEEGYVQGHAINSPSMSLQYGVRSGQGAPDNGMPLSPVSQSSNAGPPSVSSMATQSPRLNSSFVAGGRRQSSQLSQPGTPVTSTVPTAPSVQNFVNSMGMRPQQQSSSGFQQQPTSAQPQDGQQQGYQIAQGQQYQSSAREPSGSYHMPGQYQQAMVPGRPLVQMQHSDGGPPVPPKDSRDALQQSQVADRPVRQGSPGASKWKGLRNRMSGQIAHKSAPSQGKGENDKLTASKILGAFKRGSKENRQSMVIPDFQAYQQHQMRPVQQQPAQQQARQPQQHSSGQVPYTQTQSPRPASQISGQAFGQVPTPRPSSQLSNLSQAQIQARRGSAMFGSPNLPQQQFRGSSGTFPSNQSGMAQPQPGHAYQSPPQAQGQFPPSHPYSPQAQFHSPPQQHGQFRSPVQQQGQFQSPAMQQGQFRSPVQHQGQFQSPAQQQQQQQQQFQSPPQPLGQWQQQRQSSGGQFPPAQSRQSSYPGQWQGTVGQSPNSSTHQSPRHSQFPQQANSPQFGHDEESHPVHVSTPDTVHSPTPVHAPSPRPSLLNLLASGKTEDELTQGIQPEYTKAAPRIDQSNTSHNENTNKQRFAGTDSPQSGRTSGSPRVGAVPPSAQHVSPRIGTDQNGGSKTQAPTLPMLSFATGTMMGDQAASNATRHFSPKAEESHGVSLSPPTGHSGDVSPSSTRQSPSGVGNMSPPNTVARGGPSFHAELEDTEDARKRTLRINSQEEKIHYDPNADSDGEVPPSMSATSYPGQEWNPYGMPELGDWNEHAGR